MSLLRRPSEAVKTAPVLRVDQFLRICILKKLSIVVHATELNQLQLLENLNRPSRVPDTLGVEFHSFPSDWHGKQQYAAWSENALQFEQRLVRPQRINRISITPQPNVFCYMQAGDRGQDLILYWKLGNASLPE
jgi:hypothetical protein